MRAVVLLLAVVLTCSASGTAGAQTIDPGRRLFLQCQACHALKPGAPHKVGPNLSGISGAKAGTRAGYAYSKPMSASGVIWTDAALDRFLVSPSAMIPGTKMVFAGVRSPADRKVLIEYMKRPIR